MSNPFDTIDARLSNIESLLLDISLQSTKQPPKPEQDQLLTVQQAAEFLTLSVPTIYGLISKGELPVMKRSKRCYFSKVELVNYLKQGRKKTLAETASEAEAFLSNRKKKEVSNA